jgi:hypothetical protein
LYLQQTAVEIAGHRRPHAREFNSSGVMRGLDPRIHLFARSVLIKRMDCWVNPRIKSGGGNDELG